MSYRYIYECCLRKFEELNIHFDFNHNVHLNSASSLDDVFKNLVMHSQNRSQGGSFNFWKYEHSDNQSDVEKAHLLWNTISNFHFNLNDKLDYINLFNEIKMIPFIDESIRLESGKDIQYLQLCKTCQCIKNYLSTYNTLEDYINENTFTNDVNHNWRILKTLSDKIYNMGTELVPDFFKEQDYIIGREFIIKADIHVKRFFTEYCEKEKELSDRQVYSKMMELYNAADLETQNNIKPYQVDKLIFLIGEKFHNPNEMKRFVLECKNING